VSQRPDLIERASLATATAGDTAALRHRLRHAPATVRHSIDRDRRAHGLDPLWPATASKPAGVAISEKFAYRLFGVAAPHISRPVTLPGDAGTLPEMFSTTCWRQVIRRLADRRPVPLRVGHDGHEIASTSSGTLRFDTDAKLGLLVIADLQELSLAGLASRSASSFVELSLGFLATKTETRTVLGERVRVVLDAVLDHVAVLPSGFRPAYPGAVGRLVATSKPAALRDAWSDVKHEAYVRLTQRKRP